MRTLEECKKAEIEFHLNNIKELIDEIGSNGGGELSEFFENTPRTIEETIPLIQYQLDIIKKVI